MSDLINIKEVNVHYYQNHFRLEESTVLQNNCEAKGPNSVRYRKAQTKLRPQKVAGKVAHAPEKKYGTSRFTIFAFHNKNI